MQLISDHRNQHEADRQYAAKKIGSGPKRRPPIRRALAQLQNSMPNAFAIAQQRQAKNGEEPQTDTQDFVFGLHGRNIAACKSDTNRAVGQWIESRPLEKRKHDQMQINHKPKRFNRRKYFVHRWIALHVSYQRQHQPAG